MKNDLANKQFAYLLALYPVSRNKRTYWVCHCNCGKTVEVERSNLLSGRVRSCGCQSINDRDISGRRQGHLTVLRRTGRRDAKGGYVYEWRCDCGTVIEKGSRFQGNACPECLRKARIARMPDINAKINRDDKTGLTRGGMDAIRNGKTYKNNKSGVRGVCWSKENKKWEAYGKIDGKYKLLGCFKELEDAKIAREENVKQILGE